MQKYRLFQNSCRAISVVLSLQELVFLLLVWRTMLHEEVELSFSRILT